MVQSENRLFICIVPIISGLMIPAGNKYENVDEDPGVMSVTSIYHYMRYFGYNTIVMGE